MHSCFVDKAAYMQKLLYMYVHQYSQTPENKQTHKQEYNTLFACVRHVYMYVSVCMGRALTLTYIGHIWEGTLQGIAQTDLLPSPVCSPRSA